MKTVQSIAALAMLVAAHSTTVLAEDVDLYSGLGGAAGRPNVLIVFDNAANFSSDAGGGASCIIDGVPTALSGTVGGIEQCAFYNVINNLPVDQDGNAVVNIGMMAYNANNIRDINNANCGGSDGGCLMVPLTPMVGTEKAKMLAWIKSWRTSGGAGDGYVKATGEATAAAMQEAWAYYAGSTGLSGRSYAGVAPSAGCQQNFVIFIGNSFSNAGSPGEGGSASPKAALASAPGVTTQLKSVITGTYQTVCGGASYTLQDTNVHESKGQYLDEWARYMYQRDLYGSIDGSQSITTYTIGLVNPNTCQAEYAALLNSTADVGGGKYFATTDYASITNALLKILNEIQAVNSVFSSSSLPISTNTQGTYENKIFMGMFRPDGGGNPRWVGNLKQYQFILDAGTGRLQLGDSLGQPAISSTKTGFISPNAVSFWTCGGNPSVRACSPTADPTGGFWARNPQSAGGAYDLPDGEMVEKGGAAQIIRLTNLTNDYTTSAESSTNPRKLYTYCPAGSSCVATLADTSNKFATTNSAITANMFGDSATVKVTSIVRSGTSALVTTALPHGYSSGTNVAIQGAKDNAYNVTQSVTVNTPTTFTITGLPDNPPTPTTGVFTANIPNASTQDVATIVRDTSSTSTANTETVKVTTVNPHPYATGDSVQITGVTPAEYGVTTTITVTGANEFTYSVPITPITPATGFNAVVSPYTRSLSSITKVSSVQTATTSANHGFHAGQTVTISGTPDTGCNTNVTVATIPSATKFTFSQGGCGATTGGSVKPSAMPVSLTALTRTGTGATATASATVATANAFANGDLVNVAYASGSAPANLSAYVATSVPIACTGTCTTFTYSVPVTPVANASGTIKVALATPVVTIAAGKITRSGTTATVTGVPNTFTNGATVVINASGTVPAAENPYLGTWTIACPVACSTAFTFGPVALSPITPAEVATGATSITAYAATSPPPKDPLINWVRGEDSTGDEKSLCPPGTAAGVNACPTPRVTIRPSVHGDVLHSRPAVINYGGPSGRGVVVFYGANDGVFRAVDGNQSANGGKELWGFIPTEFFSRLARQQTNSPPMLVPTTPPGISPTPEPKDYFVDGMVGVYQLLNADESTNKAYLYLSMRRGGALLYALDVSDPLDPKFVWKIDPTGLTTTAGLDSLTVDDYIELGQTWSQPKVALVEGYVDGSGKPKPVLVFGAGYDTGEDSEPPKANTSGRGIYIVDAVSGQLVWSVTAGASTACGGDATKAKCTVANMNYSIPADITLVDRDRNNLIDRLYAADVGGNVWRIDLNRPRTCSPAPCTPPTNDPTNWRAMQLAALGCDNGPCAANVNGRKFFYPVDVVTGQTYDAVIGGTGDREHPLVTSPANSVQNQVYMLKDLNPGMVGNAPVGSPAAVPAVITKGMLFDNTCTTTCTNPADETTCTTTCPTPSYSDGAKGSDGTTTPNRGYFINLASGEKVVNAPLTVAGYAYMGTNKPKPPSPNTCGNLGEARGYYLSPLSGEYGSSIFEGGGLPPSPVAGLVNITVTSSTGQPVNKLIPFIIGAGAGPGGSNCVGPDCKSAFGGGKPTISVPTSRTRIYWYREMD